MKYWPRKNRDKWYYCHFKTILCHMITFGSNTTLTYLGGAKENFEFLVMFGIIFICWGRKRDFELNSSYTHQSFFCLFFYSVFLYSFINSFIYLVLFWDIYLFLLMCPISIHIDLISTLYFSMWAYRMGVFLFLYHSYPSLP